jgi:alkyl hydroperoxide reductase subunit AhpC
MRSDEGVAAQATFIVDPDNTIQHVDGTNLNGGWNLADT